MRSEDLCTHDDIMGEGLLDLCFVSLQTDSAVKVQSCVHVRV